MNRLDSMTNKWNGMIERAKLYNKMGKLEKDSCDKLVQLTQFSLNKDSQSLARTLVEILDLIGKLRIEASSKTTSIDENAKLSMQANNLKIQVEDLITNYCK